MPLFVFVARSGLRSVETLGFWGRGMAAGGGGKREEGWCGAVTSWCRCWRSGEGMAGWWLCMRLSCSSLFFVKIKHRACTGLSESLQSFMGKHPRNVGEENKRMRRVRQAAALECAHGREHTRVAPCHVRMRCARAHVFIEQCSIFLFASRFENLVTKSISAKMAHVMGIRTHKYGVVIRTASARRAVWSYNTPFFL